MAPDRGMSKAEAHAYDGIHRPGIKKKAFAATWIDQEIILSEDRERQRSDIAYIAHQKSDTNQVGFCFANRCKITDLEYKLTATKGDR